MNQLFSETIKVPARGEGFRLQQLASQLTEIHRRVLASGIQHDGPEVAALERKIERLWGAPAVCCDSGTDALEIALLAAGIGRGDEVIVPALSFISSAFAIHAVGAKAVFVDSNPETLTIDPTAAKAALSPRTRAIIAVHLFGHPADVEPLLEIAEEHPTNHVFVIGDAAQAHGAQYHGRTVGNLGCDFECFSLAPVKNVGGKRFGGVVTYRDADDEKSLRQIANLGRSPGERYLHETYGIRSNMDEENAAVVALELEYLERWNEQRRAFAALYTESFARYTPRVRTPGERPDVLPVYWQYALMCESKELREGLHQFLCAQGIESVYYPCTLPDQPVYHQNHIPHKKMPLPIAEAVVQRHLLLPIYPELSLEQQEHVIRSVQRYLAYKGGQP